jgi:hypothetical protein
MRKLEAAEILRLIHYNEQSRRQPSKKHKYPGNSPAFVYPAIILGWLFFVSAKK